MIASDRAMLRPHPEAGLSDPKRACRKPSPRDGPVLVLRRTLPRIPDRVAGDRIDNLVGGRDARARGVRVPNELPSQML